MCVFVHVCSCTQKPQVSLRCCSSGITHLILRQGLSLAQNFLTELKWLTSKPQRPSCLSPSSAVTGVCHCTRFLKMWLLGMKLISSSYKHAKGLQTESPPQTHRRFDGITLFTCYGSVYMFCFFFSFSFLNYFKNLCIYFTFGLCACAFNTLTTISCSSVRKALLILSRTHATHMEPPQALLTRFFVLDNPRRTLGLTL